MVKYASVYPGIDLVYHGKQRLLEYDFVVAPGAGPRAIGIRFQGARRLTVNREGALVIGLGSSEVIEPAPVVYQEIGGHAFVSKMNAAGSALVYSTYLGGSMYLTVGDAASSVAVDASGNA